jgi:hypothetical protein
LGHRKQGPERPLGEIQVFSGVELVYHKIEPVIRKRMSMPEENTIAEDLPATQPPLDNPDLLLCKICGTWIDRHDLEEVFDHLDHHTGGMPD